MRKIMLVLILISVFLVYCNLDNNDTASEIRGSISSYNYYYGTIHNHTNLSDGLKTPAEAYAYARDIGDLDFFGLADHDYYMDSNKWAITKTAADAYNQDNVFIAFRGFEWSHSTYGHVAVVNSTDYCLSSSASTDTFSELVTWLSTRDCVAFFNHPGRQNSTGVEFNHFTSSPSAKFVGMELWNKNEGFNVFYYNDGYFTNDGNKGFFDESLSRGWKTGASGSDDNHKGTFGTENNYRMCILSSQLTKTALLQALEARRFFSTADKNLKLYFEIGGYVMGSTIPAGTYTALIQAADINNEVFTKAELLKNGAVIQTWNISTTSPNLTYTVTAAEGDYFYVRIKQTDLDEAISSPIWFSSSPTIPPTETVFPTATRTTTIVPSRTVTATPTRTPTTTGNTPTATTQGTPTATTPSRTPTRTATRTPTVTTPSWTPTITAPSWTPATSSPSITPSQTPIITTPGTTASSTPIA